MLTRWPLEIEQKVRRRRILNQRQITLRNDILGAILVAILIALAILIFQPGVWE